MQPLLRRRQKARILKKLFETGKPVVKNRSRKKSVPGIPGHALYVETIRS